MKKQDKKKKQEEDLPVITLESCESFDPSAEKRESEEDSSCEPDFDID